MSGQDSKAAKIFIWGFSIIVTGLVTFLYLGPKLNIEVGFDPTILPMINACINATVSVLLILALVMAKRKKIKQHKFAMLTACGLSALFLVIYVFYHSIAEETKFGGEGTIKYIYLFILATHIVLAAGVLPFILITVLRGLTGKVEKHKKIARWTWPIWYYVAVSGVLVYLFLSPYY